MSFPALFLIASAAAATYYPPPDAQGGWRAASTPASARLDQAFDYIRGTTKHGGLLVVHHGTLIYEKYFGRGSRDAAPNLASCGKSFTSISVGILMKERPELFPDGLDQKVFTRRFGLEDSAKAEIKLGQLLAMTSGLRGNSPGYVDGKPVVIDPPGADGSTAMIDSVALATNLWTKPGAGYSYATTGAHILSIMLRNIAGMELQQYIEERLARPMGWGRWGFGYRRREITHTPGGGGIELRATDMLRFAYMLLHRGEWAGRQLVPAEYVEHCGRRSPYNPHYPYSLQFQIWDRGAFGKQGSGGHCFYVVPDLDLVAFKLGGRDEQYAKDTPYDGSREDWKHTPGAGDGIEKTLELIRSAVQR